MSFSRSSGVLLHPTSLAGRFGIGDLGKEAYRFADFLIASDQSLWQVLPLGPTGFGDSPYQCFSSFASNPLLISPERLVEDGLLTEDDIKRLNGGVAHVVQKGTPQSLDEIIRRVRPGSVAGTEVPRA